MLLKRKPTFFEAISCLVVMALLVGGGYGVLKLRIEMMLIASAVYTGFIAMRLGMTWKDMEGAIAEKTAKIMPAIFIIFTVGIVIGTFIYAGTIPMMIFYGLKIISPKYLIVSGFIICAILSTVTGTSWGSAGTAGVAIMGIAYGLGVPLHITAAAVVSGSIFGDKLSPLSDTTNLAALSAGVDLYDHIKHMLYTTIPASLVAMVAYLIVGLQFSGDLVMPEKVTILVNTLDTIFNWNVFLLIPFLIILGGSITKKPTIPTMLFASFVAILIGMFSHGFAFKDAMTAAVSGFNVNMVKIDGFDPNNVIWEVTRLIHRGGIKSMFGVVTIVYCAYGFAAIAEKAGFLEVILNSFIDRVNSAGQAVATSVVSSVLLVYIAGTCYISIIMIGELFKDPYIKNGLHLKNLSRTLEDAGTMIVGLVPWGSSGVYYLGILGIGPLEYGAWAIPLYLCPILAIIYGYTGFGMAKLNQKNSTKTA
ncbi:Na+/H+ antiporter NhaC [Wukongibacter baidiensis]|uniref:Na+/H+ antiporter NhaC n=1 Tax=Wukongibacter baidiensis TaxID=1723361 RepID=UPI003D7FAD34